MNWLAVLSRSVVLLCYAALFVHAVIVLHRVTHTWIRKASLAIIAMISAYWTAFYTYLLVELFDTVAQDISIFATLSRIGHIGVAVGLWTIVSFINVARREYAIVPLRVDKL